MAEQLTTGVIFTALTTAVGWLAKKLYDAPRPLDYTRVVQERDDLRQIITDAADEAKQLSAKRDIEYQKLLEEVLALRAKVYGPETGGADAAVPAIKQVRPTARRRQAGNRKEPSRTQRSA